MDREDIKEITSLDGEVGYMPFKTLVCNVFTALYPPSGPANDKQKEPGEIHSANLFVCKEERKEES